MPTETETTALVAQDGFDEYYTEKLWNWIPGLYHEQDANSPTPGTLRRIVESMGEQSADLRRNLDRIWENFFVELADDDGLESLGELVATRMVHALNRRARRVDVARTIYYRRRKGTPRVLESLITDMTGWAGAHLEARRRLGRTYHLLEPGPDTRRGAFTQTPRGGWADLRSQRIPALAWSAFEELNHIAEQQGMVTSVVTTYDPKTKLLVISDEVDASWTTWLSDHNQYWSDKDATEEKKYLYLRVWDRGPETVDVSHPAEIHLGEDPAPFPAIALGSTGLEVTLSQGGVPGDYWIIAARPSTPDAVVPWDLADAEVPPHGPRRFYAPLARIDWVVDGETLSTVTDCRTRLRRLCEGGCCTVTLGDAKHSFGMVNSFADAIELISDGGTLCVLPGIHVGAELLDGHKDIIIQGCGRTSVLRSPVPTAEEDSIASEPELFYDSVLTLRDCERIQIKNLRIEAHSAVGVMIETSAPENVCEDILLEDLEVFSSGSVNGPNSVYEFAAPCVAVRGASEVVIRRCNLVMDNVSSIAAAVVLSGSRLRLLDSRVAAPVFDGGELGAMGGVQIRSATHEVDVIGCEIVGGWGNGISLGQVEYFLRTDNTPLTTWEVQSYPVGGGMGWLTTGVPGNLQYLSSGAMGGSGEANVWLPVGPVESVRIHDNVIRQVGLSGVASMEFFHSYYDWDGATPGPVFLVAIDVDVCRNRIEDNVKLATELPGYLAYRNDRCVGGVCLAGSINATIRENEILRNGTGSSTTPICGVGLVAAQNALIADNRIIDNGPQAALGGPPNVYGLRGGIAIAEVTKTLGYTMTVAPQAGLVMPLPVSLAELNAARGASAVVVRGNEVSQPLGRALWVQRGFGAITVTGNSFESFGNPVPGDAIEGVTLRWVYNGAGGGGLGIGTYDRPASGACVQIVNYGLALDIDWSEIVAPKPAWADNSDSAVDGGNVLLSGNVMSLDWEVLGGHACSVLISTLGSAVYDSNTSSVTTRNLYGTFYPQILGVKPMKEFLEEITSKPGAMSLVLTNVYIGGKSTVQASGNRSTENKFDALFSLVAGPALAPAGDNMGNLLHASSVIANVGSHCWVAGFVSTTTNDSKDYNISVYPDEDIEDCGTAYSVTATDIGSEGRVISIS